MSIKKCFVHHVVEALQRKFLEFKLLTQKHPQLARIQSMETIAYPHLFEVTVPRSPNLEG